MSATITRPTETAADRLAIIDGWFNDEDANLDLADAWAGLDFEELVSLLTGTFDCPACKGGNREVRNVGTVGCNGCIAGSVLDHYTDSFAPYHTED